VGSPTVRLARDDAGIRMSWTPVGGVAFDVVEGDLPMLRLTGGFVSSVGRCVANDVVESEVPIPAEAEDRFYLVRPTFCQSTGSYDTGSSGQIATRDPGIETSGVCP
jgi:hypothetical protein